MHLYCEFWIRLSLISLIKADPIFRCTCCDLLTRVYRLGSKLFLEQETTNLIVLTFNKVELAEGTGFQNHILPNLNSNDDDCFRLLQTRDLCDEANNTMRPLK